MKRDKRIVSYIFIFVLGAFVAVGGLYLYKDEFSFFSGFNSGACYTSCQNKVTVTDKGIADAVDKVYKSVVLIQNYKNDKLYSTGTGFVYKVDSKNGYVLSNYHVVNGASKIKVVRSDDKVVSATYVSGDEYLDVAVLKIDASSVLAVAEVGSSTNARLGDTVFTVGTPVDYQYRGTVTRGILSGKDRLVSLSLSSNSNIDDYVLKVLQTDASINPGNSGGPLVDSNGKVIGINSLKIVKSEIEGMGFALPIEDVMTNISTFEAGKKIERPYLGIRMYNASDVSYSRYLGIDVSTSVVDGVVVVEVEKDSCVSDVLKKGDVIVKLGGNKTDTIAYLRYELYKHKAGDSVDITFIRDGKTVTKSIKLNKLKG
jgi:serine protease Do